MVFMAYKHEWAIIGDVCIYRHEFLWIYVHYTYYIYWILWYCGSDNFIIILGTFTREFRIYLWIYTLCGFLYFYIFIGFTRIANCTNNSSFKMWNYISAFLRSIRKTSRTDFGNFQLSHTLMSKIVALGLKKQPRDRPYRISRVGKRLFHYIETIVSRKKTKTTGQIITGVNKSNLVPIEKKARSTKFFTIAHVNIRSIRNQAPQVQLELGTQVIDICAITETWLKPHEEESILLQQITPPGYDIISYPRQNGKTGGRLVVVQKNHIKLQKHCILQTLGTMECGHFQIKFGSEMVLLFVIYCIPNISALYFFKIASKQ